MIRRPTRLTRLLAVLAALIACTLLWVGCSFSGSQDEEATPTPYPTSIVPEKPTYTVQRGRVIQKLEFGGRVAPVIEEELVFRTSGYVEKINVESDQWAKAGDVLAELEVTDLKDQLAQAEAALESALSRHEEQVAEAQANLHAAELHLSIAQASDPDPQIAVAEVALKRAQLALENAQKDYQETLDSSEASDEVREAAARKVQEAELDLDGAKANQQKALQARAVYSYTVQLQEQDVALAELRLQRLETGVDVEEMRLAVERLNSQLEDARLIAPFDGQVLALSISEGHEVEAYTPALILIDPSELEVRAELTDTDLRNLSEGMPVTATPSGQPGQAIPGYILTLPYPYGGGGQSGSSTDIVSTRVVLESTDMADELALGDRVDIVVVLEQKDDVLWLPAQAIRNFEGRKFVVVQDGAAQMRKDVKTGIEGDGRVEIVEGLEEGQTVVGQ
jgi:RND family efflux transporter MFP subunit